MQLIYEGKDITADVEIRKADLTDNSGMELDSLELYMNDVKGLWSQWKPEKNHSVRVKESGFDSGVMYIDEIGQQRGLIILKALPIKQESKTEFSKAWDEIRLFEFTQEIAAKHNLVLQTFNVENPLYTRVDQIEQADLQFLAYRCLLEGYALKVSGNKLIIYNESVMEAQLPAKTLTPDDFDGRYSYKNKSNQIYGACKILSSSFPFEFRDNQRYGPTLKVKDLSPGSLGESERFSKGLLRAKNKFERTFIGTIRLDTGLAGGNVLRLNKFGLADEDYFAYQVIHKFIDKKTELRLRGRLEGY